jgi:hypothetical protein
MHTIKSTKAVGEEGLVFVVVSDSRSKRSIRSRELDNFFVEEEYTLQHFIEVPNKLVNI